MLKNVLKEISNSRTYNKLIIAKNLNISENMVEELVSQLIRMGYLSEDMGSPTCDTPCGRCPYATMCHSTPVNMINLTDKGKKLLVEV